MTIWLVLTMAIGGWLAWEAWRGMARAEVWSLYALGPATPSGGSCQAYLATLDPGHG